MLTFRGKRWLLGGAVLILSLAMLACTGGAPGPGGAPGQPGQIQLTTAGFQIVDPTKFPEPPEGSVGWVPPEDLKATPKRGGVLKLNAGGWTRLDPHFPNVPATERWLARMYASGLLKWDLKTNAPVLDLAESWEESPDKLSYTFKIRKGVKFHNVPPVNGRELKAEDVKWSLDRISGLVRQPGQVSFNFARFESLKEVQIIDDYTVRLIMKQPDNAILREIMYEFTVILPKEAAIDGQFNEGKALIGTGPFIAELVVGQGLSKFRRNPDWFDKGPDNKPYLDGIEAHTVAREVMGPALKTRQLDWVISWIHPIMKQFFGDPGLRIYATRGNDVGTTGIWINPYVGPLRDIRVRRAIHLAIDRDEFIKIAHDGGAYLVGFFGGYWQPWLWTEEKLRSLPGWRKNKEEDYAEARKLLAEAGYPSGLTITCECEDIIGGTPELLVQQFKRVGITLKINLTTGAVMRHTAYMKDKQISNATQGGLHTPDGPLVQGYLCNSAKNLSTVCDEEIERLWKAYRKEFDQKKMAELMDKIQQRLYDVMVVAPTARFISYHVSYKYVRGWRNAFYDCCFAHAQDFVNVWLDK